MDFILVSALFVTTLLPLVYAYKKRNSPKNAKVALVINICSVFALIFLVAGLAFSNSAYAADTATGEAAASSGSSLAFIAAGLAVGLSCVGGGIAVASSASSALGAISENPKIFGQALIMVVLAEGIAIYGMLIAVLILNKI